ncbi:response regulator transcription factor [Nitrosococcus oceani]|uniref:response regulator transcription factor n=1 Tax=Nitrosococcus oceani TaxID=1229 RepID=UPI0004E8A128|nr:LuxR C-terminal-related transcriptional regulator [Nitrosococcus oceani]KFI22766.1 LuxR family transcriptional regulator [Nitrosococcus oceani]
MQLDKPAVFIVGVGEKSHYRLLNLFHCAELIVEDFETAEAFLDSDCWKKPGCVLLELSLPEADGLALQRQLHAANSRVPVIMLVDPDDIVNAVQALKQGAVDVLEKTVGEQAVLNSVFRAVSQAVFFWEKEKQIESARRRLSSLILREKQILDLVLRGTLNKVIAYELEISMKTVEVHRHNMMEKLSAKNLVELINLVATAGGREIYCLQPRGAATLGSPIPLSILTPATSC